MHNPEIPHAYQGGRHTYADERIYHQEQQGLPPFQGTPYQQPLYSQPSSFAPLPDMGDGRLSALLSYALGWFSGLLFFLFAGRHPYIRFHALQSLVFFGAINLLDIGLITLMADRWLHFIWRGLPFVAMTLVLCFMLLNIIAFVAWIVGMIQASRGLYYRLPFIGDIVAGSSNAHGVVK